MHNVNLNSALNFVMKERAGQGIGVETAQAKFITEEQEKYLWEHGFLGSTNAALLRDTLVYVFGMQFALRAGQEHRNLRRENRRSYRYKLTNSVINICSITRISAKLTTVD